MKAKFYTYRKIYLKILVWLWLASIVIFVGIGLIENSWLFAMISRTTGYCLLGIFLMGLLTVFCEVLWPEPEKK